MNRFEDAAEHDDVTALEAIGVTDADAASLIAHLIYSARMWKYPLPIQCVEYLLENFDLCAKDVVGYKISSLFFSDPEHGETKQRILQALVSKGYRVEEYGLYQAASNRPVLEYLLDLPEESWIHGIRTNRVPFLVNRIMYSEDPTYFTERLHRYVARKSERERTQVLNLTPVGLERNPLQSISTFYGARSTCRLAFQDMPRAIQTAKLLIDLGADPFHTPSILCEEQEHNPPLGTFMESYAQQKTARQILQDLLRVQPHVLADTPLPFDVLIHTCTRHMRLDNPYNARFVERLYHRYDRLGRKDAASEPPRLHIV